MKEETKTRLLNILRWVFFLPASVLGAWLAFIIFYWMNHTIPVFNADNLWNKITELVAQIIMGGVFVGIGTYMVPKGNKIVAIILFAITCIIAGISFIANIAQGFKWMPLLGGVCAVIGAGYVLYHFINNE